MKIYISMDMEGIPGTINWEHEKRDPLAVKKCIRDHIEDLIHAIRCSKQNMLITNILIADSHSNGENLDYDITALDDRIELISGGPRPYYMMPLLDESFDMVFLVGYHASTGAMAANMDHTYSNSRIQKIWVNNLFMSEALINAAYAGCKGVPVTLVSGDLALWHELVRPDAMPWIEYVTTKEGVSKFAARNYNKLRVRAALQEAVIKALNGDKQASIYQFQSPYTVRIEFHSTAMADMACMMPYVKRIDGKTVEYTCDSYPILFEAIMALITLAYGAGI